MTRASGCPAGLLSHNSCLGDQSNLPSPDVSRRLPAELLASVFIYIARHCYTDEKYTYCTPTTPSWINVSYVCRYWRDVALNCPTLWSYIPATSQCWTQALLARSQTAPLRINTNVISSSRHVDPRQEQMAQMLSIVEQVMNHSQRIQKLHLNVGVVSREIGYQIVSKFLFTDLPCLQHLEISYFHLPKGKSFEQNAPALRTLRLRCCEMPWCAIGPNDLTTLHLSLVGTLIKNNTMAEFLVMLRRMPHLVQLSVEGCLPSARAFLSDGTIDATPTISLPHLSNMSITMAPLSAVTALLSCVDVPLKTQVHLEVHLELRADYISTLDDYVRLAFLIGKRISQPDSPKFRSLTIGNRTRIALSFSTSERVEYYSRDSLFEIGSDDNAPLKVVFVPHHDPMDTLDYPVFRGICNQIPLRDIESINFLGSSLDPEFWRDMLGSLSNVRHIRFSRYEMPNITSMLSLPSLPFTSLQDGQTDKGHGEIFVPALEELELHKAILGVRGRMNPNPSVADVQDVYDAIVTRKETRCRLTIKECRLMPVEGVVEIFDLVGLWEGDQFKSPCKVGYGVFWSR